MGRSRQQGEGPSSEDAIENRDAVRRDISELGDDAFLKNTELNIPRKQIVTIRLDADVLDWFKKQGKGYQTRINKLLRSYMEANKNK